MGQGSSDKARAEDAGASPRRQRATIQQNWAIGQKNFMKPKIFCHNDQINNFLTLRIS
jgi:hypothetical protein